MQKEKEHLNYHEELLQISLYILNPSMRNPKSKQIQATKSKTIKLRLQWYLHEKFIFLKFPKNQQKNARHI